MRVTASVRRRQDNEHGILDELAKLMPEGHPLSGVSYTTLAKKIGQTSYTLLTAKRTFEETGILRTTIANRSGRGRIATWELAMPVKRAHDELSREHGRQAARPSRSAQKAPPATLARDALEALRNLGHEVAKDREQTARDLERLIEESGGRAVPASKLRAVVERLRE